MKSSLLISTYNWPEALQLVLKSVEFQSEKPDEILIADDGSTEATSKLIELFQENSAIPVKHVWQVDKGFRRSAILNKALAGSTADYIIQTDGDCILHKDFVKDHLALAKEKTYLYGSRVNIQKNYLVELFEKQDIKFIFFSKGIKKRSRNLRIPFLSNFYKESRKVSDKLRGCNLSFWKKDFVEVNGYNEEMEGWGREDSELIHRMSNRGVVGKRLRYRGIIYHIWHLVKNKENLATNNSLQEKTRDEKKVWCENGIDKYFNK